MNQNDYHATYQFAKKKKKLEKRGKKGKGLGWQEDTTGRSLKRLGSLEEKQAENVGNN